MKIRTRYSGLDRMGTANHRHGICLECKHDRSPIVPGGDCFHCYQIGWLVTRNFSEQELSSLIKSETLPPIIQDLSSSSPTREIHHQMQSVLFNRLPAEIRLRIFEYAFTATDMPEYPMPRRAHIYRPGNEYYKHIYTDLLRTCRRIYLETFLLPASANESVWWCYTGPPSLPRHANLYNLDFKITHSIQPLLARPEIIPIKSRLPTALSHAIPQITIDCSRTDLDWTFITLCPVFHSLASECRPRKIKIILRNRDWDDWCGPSGDFIKPHRLRAHRHHSARSCAKKVLPDPPESECPGTWWQFEQLQGLRELEMQFETIDAKAQQVDEVVRRAVGWTFKLADGKVLSAEGSRPVRERWTGLGDRHISSAAPAETGTETGPEKGKIRVERIAEDMSVGGDAIFKKTPPTTDQIEEEPTQPNVHDRNENCHHLESRFHVHDHLADLAADDDESSVIERQDYYVVTVRWRARNATTNVNDGDRMGSN